MYCPFCHDRAGDLFEPGGRRHFHTSGESASDIYLNPDLSRRVLHLIVPTTRWTVRHSRQVPHDAEMLQRLESADNQ